MALNFKVRQIGLLLVLVPLVCELAFVILLVYTQQQAESALRRETHSKDIVATVQHVVLRTYDVAGAFVAFCVKKTKQSEAKYQEATRMIPDEIEALHKLIADDPVQMQNYQKLKDESDKALTMMAGIRQRIDNDETIAGKFEALKLHAEVRQRLNGLIGATIRISDEEETRAKLFPAREASTRMMVATVVAVGVAFNILVSVLMAWYFSRRITGRLSTIVNNALRLARDEPLAARMDSTDEIGQLDDVFHNVALTLQEASRRERAIVDNVQDAICTIDTKMMLTKVSPAAARLWDHHESELLGQRLVNIIAEDDRPALLQAIEQAKNSRTVISHDARVTRNDGNSVWMLWSIYWSQTEDAFFCVAHDVNERKMLDQLKKDFVNMVSHDLRTPLTALRAFLQTLTVGGYGEVSQKAKNSAQRLEGSVERLVHLINDLLDIEKMEAGRMELTLAPTKFSQVIEAAMDMINTFAEQQQVTLEVNTQTDAEVEADSDRLVQVMQNLVSNAIKFSPAGSKVEIWVSREGADAQINIRDQGPGINTEDQAMIFDRFHQLKTNPSKGGSGLGLAICKAIIDQHGGAIGVASQPGAGSTFWFKLPQLARLGTIEPASNVDFSPGAPAPSRTE